MTDISTPENRNQNFGYLGIASGGAFILGPALAGILSHVFRRKTTVMMAFIISLLATLLIIFFLPESKKQTKEA